MLHRGNATFPAWQPLRIAIYLASLATLFIGPLSHSIGRRSGVAIATWKLLYITVEGVTCLWCLVLFWLLPDNPATWKVLNDRERYIAIDRVRVDQTGIENKPVKWSQVIEAMIDPKSWVLLCGQIMTCTFLVDLRILLRLLSMDLDSIPSIPFSSACRPVLSKPYPQASWRTSARSGQTLDVSSFLSPALSRSWEPL